jgi:hypothetical protein
MLSSGVSYKNQLDFIITNIIDIAILVIFYFILRNVIKEKMRGKLLAQIGFYGFLAGYVIWLIVSFILISKLPEVKDFAVNSTPKAFNSDLSELPNYSTKDLAKIVEYSKEFEGYKEKMIDVGTLKECSFTEDDTTAIGYGPYVSYGNIKLGFVAGYSIRCYGESKILGIGASIKTEDGVWKISDFVFNSNLTKNTDIEKTELEDNIKSIKSDN